MDKNKNKIKSNININIKEKNISTKDKSMNNMVIKKQKYLNTNLSIVINNRNNTDYIANNKKEIDDINNIQFKVNNPKKYLDIINDDCFHLEMNLKLLNFDKEFLREKNMLNNISSNFNPFLK